MNSDLFNLMVFLGLEVNYFFEEKTSLNVEHFHNYRLNICEELSKYFDGFYSSIPDQLKKAIEEFLNENLNMSADSEINYFSMFLKKYNDYVYFKNGTIYLRDEEDIDDILKEKENCCPGKYDKFIANHLMLFYDSEKSLSTLNANKIKNELNKLLRMEGVIEEYYENCDNKVIQNQISLGNILVESELNIISKMPENIKKSFYRLIQNISSKKYYDLSLSLISDKLEATDEFYEKNNYIDIIISNIFQQAIFSDSPLNYIQVENYIGQLLEEDFLDEPDDSLDEFYDNLEEGLIEDDIYDELNNSNSEEDSEDQEDKEALINLLFYIKYIQEINAYDKLSNNSKLQTVKKRLLYALNQYGCNLQLKDNLNITLSALKNIKFNYKEDFEEFYIMSRLFLTDILNEWSEDKEMDLRKILFISTYCNITNDKKIIEVIKPFKDTEIGKKVVDAIFNKKYEKFDEPSKYQKKKKKEENN